jgi:tyrosine-protein kinase Etk/Wzc
MACGAIGLVVSLLTSPKYEAVATVAVVQPKLEGQATSAATSTGIGYLVRNRQSAAETIGRFRLADAPYKLTPERFATDIVAVNDIRTTNLLNVSVTLRDPKLAADVVNDVVARAIQTSRRLTDEQAGRSSEVFGVQLQQQQKELQTAQEHLIAFRIDNHLNVLGDDVATVLGDQTRSDLFSRLMTASGRLADADRQIAKLPPEKQSALAQLQLQYDLARASYARAQTDYQNSKVTVETRSSDLQVIDPAIPPDRPVSPRPVRDTVLALLIGAVGASLAVVIASAARRDQ